MPRSRRLDTTAAPVAAPAGARSLVAVVLGTALIALAAPAEAATPAGAAPSAAPPVPRTTAQAGARAGALLAQVQALQRQTGPALRRYDTALAAVSVAVTNGIAAEQLRQAEVRAAAAAQDRADRRIRGLYISGGRAAMLSSLLSADGLADLTSRVVTMAHLVADGQSSAAGDAAAAGRASSDAAAARTRALASIGTARDVGAAADRLQALLDQQQQLLATAEATVRQLRADEAADAAARAADAALRASQLAAAAATLRASRSAVMRSTATAARLVAPLAGSPAFLRLYHDAAGTCSGLPWTVLAAVGQVESGHGRNAGPSSAGAQGPMQFMPPTFAAYAVDGDHDGRTDISDPADAIYTAAHFLCVHGAGEGPAGVRRALLFYNHAGWYVDLVVALTARYGAAGGLTADAPGGAAGGAPGDDASIAAAAD